MSWKGMAINPTEGSWEGLSQTLTRPWVLRAPPPHFLRLSPIHAAICPESKLQIAVLWPALYSPKILILLLTFRNHKIFT